MAGGATNLVEQYVRELPEDRQQLVRQIRDTVLRNLDAGFEEMFDFGMIVYAVPLGRYPETYNGKPLMYAALASQKQYVSLYLMNVYASPETETWFVDAYQQTGRKLRMGKSCVRFRKADEIPLELIGEAIARDTPDTFIATIERVQATRSNRKRSAKSDG